MRCRTWDWSVSGSLASTIALRLEVSQAPNESVRPLWLHSIASAIIAERLGAFYGCRGLHRRAGARPGPFGPALGGHERYAMVLGTVFENIYEANRMEDILFGMDHCKTGAFLGEKWGFPIGLQTAYVRAPRERADEPATAHRPSLLRDSGVSGIPRGAAARPGRLGRPVQKSGPLTGRRPRPDRQAHGHAGRRRAGPARFGAPSSGRGRRRAGGRSKEGPARRNRRAARPQRGGRRRPLPRSPASRSRSGRR